MQEIIVIEGPTASGKTALGVQLAQLKKSVVISADSRQFYREMAIGTAKPTVEEMQGVPHYFVDSHSIHNPVSASQFEKEGLELISNSLKDKQQIILVGGSGMFIDALCKGLDPIPSDSVLKQQLNDEYQLVGIEGFKEELLKRDPVYYHQVDLGNAHRILRAIEVIRLTNEPYSAVRLNQPAPRPFTVKRFVINHPREVLYDRINRRVDIMMEMGLLNEARQLIQFRNLSPLQTVGYKECFDYFDGITNKETCIELIKQHTRNYAKRQLTWFRRDTEAVWIDGGSTEEMLGSVIKVF